MTSRVAVMCWEQSRPWVSALRQAGYSVPWVDEPKNDVHRQVPKVEPDVLVADLTKSPEQGASILDVLISGDKLPGVPFVVVTSDGEPFGGMGEIDPNLVTYAAPEAMVEAVGAALAAHHS